MGGAIVSLASVRTLKDGGLKSRRPLQAIAKLEVTPSGPCAATASVLCMYIYIIYYGRLARAVHCRTTATRLHGNTLY